MELTSSITVKRLDDLKPVMKERLMGYSSWKEYVKDMWKRG